MRDGPSLRLEIPIEPEKLVRGVGRWSNTGRPLRYVARSVVVIISRRGAQVSYGGDRAAGKKHVSFTSDDPAVAMDTRIALRKAQAAWEAAR